MITIQNYCCIHPAENARPYKYCNKLNYASVKISSVLICEIRTVPFKFPNTFGNYFSVFEFHYKIK